MAMSVILRFKKQKGNPAPKIEGHTNAKKRNTRVIPILTHQEANTMYILSHRR